MSGMVLSEGAYINSAINTARGAMNNALAQARRSAGRYGVDPSSGKFQSLERSALYENAAQTASAATEASKNWLEAAQKQDQHDDEMALRWQTEADNVKMQQDKLNWEKDMYNSNLRKEKEMAKSFTKEAEKNGTGTQANSTTGTSTPSVNKWGQKKINHTTVGGMSLKGDNEDAYGNRYNQWGKMIYKKGF